MEDIDRDLDAYKSYIELWKSENPIKTNKLQVLLVVNGLLVSALQLAGGLVKENWFIFLTGGVFSIIWVMSIGRTSLYQKVWQIKANKIAEKYPDDPRFRLTDTRSTIQLAPGWLQMLGRVSSRYYLLGAPVVFSLLWFVALIFVSV